MKQLKAIDLFKVFAALLVVAAHARPIHSYELSCLYRLAVPFFFTVYSFLYFTKKVEFKKYAKRIMQLYAVWFVIEIGVVYSRFFSGTPFSTAIFNFTKALLFTNTFWESWYLIASVEAVGLCVLLSKKLNNWILMAVGILLYIPSLCASSYYGNLPQQVAEVIDSVSFIIPLTNSFIVAFLYIVLGKIIAERDFDTSLKTLLPMELLAVFLWACEIHTQEPFARSYRSFVMLPFVVFLLVLILKNDRFSKLPISKDTCRYFRISSTLVYLLHVIFISLISHFLGLQRSLASYALVILCSFSFSFGIIYFSKKYPILKHLY